MRKQFLVTCLFLGLSFTSALAQTYSESERAEIRRKVFGLLDRYSPSGADIIRKYEAVPKKFVIKSGGGTFTRTLGDITDLSVYTRGTSKEAILESIGTIVHEITHGFTFRFRNTLMSDSQMKSRSSFQVLYYAPDRYELIEITETFPSKKLVKYISEDLRTFRFDTYIDTDQENLATQQSGVYGLLNEFHAYYWGMKTCIDLYPYYKLGGKHSYKVWLDYVSSVSTEIQAYAEFRYYILKYLSIAKLYEPEMYSKIINNKEFVRGFLTVDRMYQDAISQYDSNIEEMKTSLTENGNEVVTEGKWFLINGHGVGTFQGDIDKLEVEMTKSVYLNILRVLKQKNKAI